MGRLVTTESSTIEKRSTAPGKAVVVSTKTGDAIERTTELYHPPGVASAPTKGDRLVEIQVGAGIRVLVASHNYRAQVNADPGETVIYSTDAEGQDIKSRISLDTEGNITINGQGTVVIDSINNVEINGDAKSLVTHAELDSALQGLLLAINTHTHPYVLAPLTPQVTSAPTIPLNIDISASSSSKLRTG